MHLCESQSYVKALVGRLHTSWKVERLEAYTHFVAYWCDGNNYIDNRIKRVAMLHVSGLRGMDAVINLEC